MGVSYTMNLVDAEPTEEQIVLFAETIRLLRDNPTEFAIFEFMNAKNKPGQQQGLVFYQMCRDGDMIHAEVRIDGPKEWRMYAITLEDDEAIILLRKMIATREAPDLAGWEDITDKVNQDDSEFE